MSFRTWSSTAASNTTIGGVSIAEGMNPSAVNDAIRGYIAENADWVATNTGGTMSGTVGGTADAVTLSPTVALTAYAVNQRFLFKATSGANTVSNPTLNVSAVGAKTIKLPGGTALPIPAWATNDMVLVAYDGTDLILVGNTKHEFSAAAANVATKATPVLADRALHQDSAASFVPKYSTWQTIFDMWNTLTQKSTPVTADKIPLSDSAASGVAKYMTVANLQAALSAVQSDEETGTSTTLFVTPGVQKFNQLHPKAWAMFNGATAGTNAPTVGSGVTSITRNAAGNYTANLATAFSTANYAFSGFCNSVTAGTGGVITADPGDTLTTTALQFRARRSDTGTLIDSTMICIFFFGDQ